MCECVNVSVCVSVCACVCSCRFCAAYVSLLCRLAFLFAACVDHKRCV